MTLRLSPVDQCEPEDLDAIADLVVRDPSASWDLAGSRAHIEALCRRYQALVQDLSAAAANCTEIALERDALKVRCASHEASRTRLGDLATDLLDDVTRITNERDAACRAIADRENEIARINNERQGEVLAAEAERERADTAEAWAEIFEAAARAALARACSEAKTQPLSLADLVHAVDGQLSRVLVRERAISAALGGKLEQAMQQLDEQQQTRALDDQLRSTCRTVTGRDLGEVNIQLDEELAAHPEPGLLHHARDQRDHQEDTTP